MGWYVECWPFFVFKGWGSIARFNKFENFYTDCLFYSKEICKFATRIMFRVNHKLLPTPKTTGYQCDMMM